MARREISLRGRHWFSHSLSEGWYLPGTGSYRGQAGNVSEGGGSSGERGRQGSWWLSRAQWVFISSGPVGGSCGSLLIIVFFSYYP